MQDTDGYTVFSGTVGMRMSVMKICLNVSKGALEVHSKMVYNYFLENHPNHNLDDQTFMSLINTIIENIHSTEVHNSQHVMNGPASIDITFSVNTAFHNEMMNQYFQE